MLLEDYLDALDYREYQGGTIPRSEWVLEIAQQAAAESLMRYV